MMYYALIVCAGDDTQVTCLARAEPQYRIKARIFGKRGKSNCSISSYLKNHQKFWFDELSKSYLFNFDIPLLVTSFSCFYAIVKTSGINKYTEPCTSVLLSRNASSQWLVWNYINPKIKNRKLPISGVRIINIEISYFKAHENPPNWKDYRLQKSQIYFLRVFGKLKIIIFSFFIYMPFVFCFYFHNI